MPIGRLGLVLSGSVGFALMGCSEYRKPEAEIVRDISRACPIGSSRKSVEAFAREHEWVQAGGDGETAVTYYLGSYSSWPGEIYFILLPDSMMVYAIFTFDMAKLETITIRKNLDGP